MNEVELSSSSFTSKVANLIVNEVNPKYRYYDRPVLLALIVGVFCYTLTIALSFALREASCRSESLLASGKEVGFFLENKNYKCIYYADVLSQESIRLDGCEIADTLIDPAYGNRISASEVEYCEGNGSTGQTPYVCPLDDNGKIVKLNYSVCDSYGTTLGAAMGYLDILKLVIGIIIVKILTETKTVKLVVNPASPSDDTYPPASKAPEANVAKQPTKDELEASLAALREI